MIQTLEQKTVGNITYRFTTPHDPSKRILYVNAIAEYQCPNSCLFCSRTDAIKGLPNIYEQKAGVGVRGLYLAQAPSVEEIVTAVGSELSKNRTDEIAFVGLGEPLLEFELVRDSITAIRDVGYRGRIRIDTNGLVKCWYGLVVFGCSEILPDLSKQNPVGELKQAGLDEIRVSVNAVNANDYQQLCRPSFSHAFEKLTEFVRDCVREGLDTKSSFVVEFDGGDVKSKPPENYVQFALQLGIKRKNIILRNYVKPVI